MNWINAKDRLPKCDQKVICHIINTRCSTLNPPYLISATYQPEGNSYLAYSFTLDNGYEIDARNFIIFWIPIEDMKLPEVTFEKRCC